MAMTFKQMRSCSIQGRKYFDNQRRQPGKLADMLLEYGNVLDMNSGTDDMYKDELFEKYKFRHSEELCNWIYEEMRRRAEDQTNDYFEREVRSSLIVM